MSEKKQTDILRHQADTARSIDPTYGERMEKVGANLKVTIERKSIGSKRRRRRRAVELEGLLVVEEIEESIEETLSDKQRDADAPKINGGKRATDHSTNGGKDIGNSTVRGVDFVETPQQRGEEREKQSTRSGEARIADESAVRKFHRTRVKDRPS